MANYSNTSSTQTSTPQSLMSKFATNQQSPAQAPTVDWSKFGFNGMSKAQPVQPVATTPLKSAKVNADGSTEHQWHADPTVKNGTTQTPEPPKIDPTSGQSTAYGQSLNPASQPTTPISSPTPTTQQTGAQIFPNNPIGAAAYDQASVAPNLRQNLTNSELARTRTGIALPFVTGQQGALEQAYGSQITGEGQRAQALSNLAGYGAPQQYSLMSQPYNPLTDTYGGGATGGAINRSIQASNIGSAGDFNSQIQQKKSVIGSLEANGQLLGSYLDGFTKAGIAPNTGIVQGINQLLAKNLISNADVSAFNNQLSSVRAQWSALNGGADANKAIPDTITPEGLRGVMDAISKKTNNDINNLQKSVDDLQKGGKQQSQPTTNTAEYNSDGTLKAVKF